MSESPRRPTAEEIEELVELVHRDAGSPAFIDLGDAYLALGRPREAIELGAAGLRANPDSLEGRLMISRAYAALHQWKEAQVELLKVVKTDRTSTDGFRLLGEVLLRRADYERALPVLQHAQNLDPANPEVLALLKRARDGKPLDPPPRHVPPSIDDEPTNVAGEAGALMRGDPTEIAPQRFDLDDMSEDEPIGAPEPARDARRAPPGPPPRAPAGSAPGTAAPAAPAKARPAPASSPPAARPEPARAPAPAPAARGSERGGELGRPRVLAVEKPKDAAQASLRQSVQVGENYLNSLLTNGLLDVPNVRAPDSEYDVRPDRRWGRSALRAFIFLFILLAAGVGGGFYWFRYTTQQKEAEVARLQQAAETAMATSSYDGYEAALGELDKALKRDDGNTYSMALYARAAGLEALLYGTPTERVDLAVSTAQRAIDQPEEKGWRDLLLARSAMTLALLGSLEQPVNRLADVRRDLDGWLKDHGEDALVRWLQGHAMLTAGDRTGAQTAFQQAEAGGKGPVVALIDRADLLLDDGNYDEAMKVYDTALKAAPDHPLALLGRALGRAERSVDSEAIETELNVKLDKELGPRVAAYRSLASSYSKYALEDYPKFDEELTRALGPREPRFLARVALGRVLQGKLADAAEARKQIAWYGSGSPQSDPLVALVDAELHLANGTPEKALDVVGKLGGLRAQLVRGRALLDMGKAPQALEELKKAVEMAKDDLDAQIWYEVAHMVASTGKERRAADEALDKLGRRAKSKVARHGHGMALYASGNRTEAERKLEQALEEVTPEAPNPLAYRTHTLLAQLAVDRGGEAEALAANLDAAQKHLEAALEQVPGFLPAQALLGRVLLRKGDAQGAAERLATVIKEKEIATAAIELAYAEAIVSRAKVSKDERTLAADAIKRAIEKGATGEELGRVALLVDPALADSLGYKPKPEPKKRGR